MLTDKRKMTYSTMELRFSFEQVPLEEVHGPRRGKGLSREPLLQPGRPNREGRSEEPIFGDGDVHDSGSSKRPSTHDPNWLDGGTQDGTLETTFRCQVSLG